MIYLVRHGEAAATWGEHPDPGLSSLGLQQATTAAQSLAQLAIHHVFSSPMLRCQETAQPFAELSQLAPAIEPNVIEIPTPGEVGNRQGWLRDLMSGVWADAPPPILKWRDALLDRMATLPDESVVFTHFIAINAVVGELEGREEVTVFRPDHCSITRVETGSEGLRLLERGREAGTKIL